MAIEVERVLNDLFPLLRTVQPEQLNYTLTALANALEGRGEEIGQSLETLDSYLKRMNPEVPALRRQTSSSSVRCPRSTSPSSRT